MKNLHFPFVTMPKRQMLVLVQFFLIVFVYHTLKDLKDSLVITASSAGAEVIPFIKIWGMLPLAIFTSCLFARLYSRYGREKSLHVVMGVLLSVYLLFAFVLHPWSDHLALVNLSSYLQTILPVGSKGFIAMISNWHFTLFYMSAELWSIFVLSIFFWGFVNASTTVEEAARFYPLCMFAGNFAGIISGVVSHGFSHHLAPVISWESTLQLIAMLVAMSGLAILAINKVVSSNVAEPLAQPKSGKSKLTFKDNIACVFKSTPLLCLAVLVVAFGVTTNLLEVVWKENIKKLYPLAPQYNAFINQLTSLIGGLAVCMAWCSKWLFKNLSWTRVALLVPCTLFTTSLFFFASLLLPEGVVANAASSLGISSLYLVVMLGSIHYVLAMTAKYTLFDTTKEIAFLSIDFDERIRAKSVIDSIGSRLGKSGSSSLYQFLLIVFGSTAGHISLIAFFSLAMIAISLIATMKLGDHLGAAGSDNEDEYVTA
jgi:AAA family ATP:ADP antiporter